MDVVWGFTKAHLKAKTIVFLSTCKQVVKGSHCKGTLREGIYTGGPCTLS